MSILKEILGLPGAATSQSKQTPNQNPSSPNQDVPTSTKTSQLSTITLSHCHNLYSWQMDIINTLRSGRDICIPARPGAGKTLPIMCYWANDVLKLPVLGNVDKINKVESSLTDFLIYNTSPKIVWAVPIIQLAININSEFRNHILELYRQFWNLTAQSHDIDKFKREVELKLARDITVLHKDTPYNTSSNNAIIIGIYESLTRLFREPSFASKVELLVIDEVHEFFQDDSRFESRIEFLDTALRAIKRNNNCKVILLSGTLNPESADSITKFLNKTYNRNFSEPTQVYPGGNQAILKILPYEGLYDQREQTKIIRKAVMDNDWGVALILFSTKKIQDLARILIEQLPYRGLRQIEQSSRYQTPESKEILSKIRKTPKTIKDINISTQGIPNEQYTELKKLGAEDLKDPLLRECVARGFGFIYRGKEELGGEISSQDKIIIEDLFRNKKISAILATDSIGVGVNIDIQKLYLSSISKFGGENVGFQEIALSNLSQLLNRVGRSATTFGLIYASPDDIPKVIQALSATPYDFDVSNLKIPPRLLLKYFLKGKILSLYSKIRSKFR